MFPLPWKSSLARQGRSRQILPPRTTDGDGQGPSRQCSRDGVPARIGADATVEGRQQRDFREHLKSCERAELSEPRREWFGTLLIATETDSLKWSTFEHCGPMLEGALRDAAEASEMLRKGRAQRGVITVRLTESDLRARHENVGPPSGTDPA